MAEYANWQSGHVESVAILWVRLPLRSLTIPWSNGEDACVTCRKVLVRFQPGSLWSVSVAAARVRGMDEDRVQFPDGRLDEWAYMPMGASWVCILTVMGSTPGTDAQRWSGPL